MGLPPRDFKDLAFAYLEASMRDRTRHSHRKSAHERQEMHPARNRRCDNGCDNHRTSALSIPIANPIRGIRRTLVFNHLTAHHAREERAKRARCAVEVDTVVDTPRVTQPRRGERIKRKGIG